MVGRDVPIAPRRLLNRTGAIGTSCPTLFGIVLLDDRPSRPRPNQSVPRGRRFGSPIIILVELVSKCSDADSKHLRCVGAVSLALLQGCQNVPFFDFTQRRKFSRIA